MGDIKLKNLEKAKIAAITFLKDVRAIQNEPEFIKVILVFTQLINCLLFKCVGDVARLTYKDVQCLSKSQKIQQIFAYRNILCHLYGTDIYDSSLSELKDLFKEDFYEDFLTFMREVVTSVEDRTFMEKYAVPSKMDSFNISEVLDEWK